MNAHKRCPKCGALYPIYRSTCEKCGVELKE